MTWNLCTCGCRPPVTETAGCPCRECQPGSGINHLDNYNRKSRERTLRLQELLRRDDLTGAEEVELSNMLSIYSYR